MNSIVSAQLPPISFSASLLIGRPKPEKPCCQRQGLSPFAIRGTEGRERLDLSRPSVPRMADPPPSDLGADTKKNHKNRLSRCDCLSRCSVYWVCVNDPFAGCYCKRPSFMSVVLYIGCALMIPLQGGLRGRHYRCCTYPLAGAALVDVRLVGRPNLCLLAGQIIFVRCLQMATNPAYSHPACGMIINVFFFAAKVKPRRGLILNNPRLRERSDRSLG